VEFLHDPDCTGDAGKTDQGSVEHPDEVNITPIEAMVLWFEVQVNPEDAGKIIGKKGRNNQCLRTLSDLLPIRHQKGIMELV
jgi:predicted RNA-binding protein YlqC (UPF0109 family)